MLHNQKLSFVCNVNLLLLFLREKNQVLFVTPDLSIKIQQDFVPVSLKFPWNEIMYI